MSKLETEYETVIAFERVSIVFNPTESQRKLLEPNHYIEFNGSRRRTYNDDEIDKVMEMFEKAFGSRFDRNDYRSATQLSDGLCILGKENGPFGAEHFAIALDAKAESGFTAYHFKTDGGRGATIYGRISLSEADAYFRECSTNIYCNDGYESEGYNPDGCEHCDHGCRYCAYKRDWPEDVECQGCFHGCRHCWDECPDDDE
jgi:hypothetical protein